MADKTITVTVATGSRYGGGTGNVFYFDSARDMSYDVVSGLTYRFVQSDSSNDGHPLVFSTAPNTTEIITSGVSYYLDGASNQSDYTDSATFNAATTRYVEITPNTTSDFYDLCFIHGVGMGGVMDIQTGVWGALGWGSGFWSQQNNADAGTITGEALTLAQGTETVTAEVTQGFGRRAWGADTWGDDTNSAVIPTGIAASFDVGTVTITAGINTGWGRSTWGSEGWNTNETKVDQSVTGQAMTMALASVTTTADVNIGWGRMTWGAQVWGNPNESAAPTGIAMSTSLGSPTITGVINTGWGRSTWGALPWGQANDVTAALTGISATFDVGSPTITAEVLNGWSRSTWGSQVWGSPNEAAALTGIGMSFTVGSPTISVEVKTGWGRSTWGSDSWGENITVVDVAVTGQEMTAVLGDETIATEINRGWGRQTWGYGNWGDAGQTISLTGFSTPMALGTVDPSPDVSVTGIEMSMNMGDEGTTVDARITLTGIALTTAIKAPNTLIWNEVPTGSAPTWTEVDTAA